MLMAATCHENNIKISNKINIIKKDESRTKNNIKNILKNICNIIKTKTHNDG